MHPPSTGTRTHDTRHARRTLSSPSSSSTTFDRARRVIPRTSASSTRCAATERTAERWTAFDRSRPWVVFIVSVHTVVSTLYTYRVTEYGVYETTGGRRGVAPPPYRGGRFGRVERGGRVNTYSPRPPRSVSLFSPMKRTNVRTHAQSSSSTVERRVERSSASVSFVERPVDRRPHFAPKRSTRSMSATVQFSSSALTGYVSLHDRVVVASSTRSHHRSGSIVSARAARYAAWMDGCVAMRWPSSSSIHRAMRCEARKEKYFVTSMRAH